MLTLTIGFVAGLWTAAWLCRDAVLRTKRERDLAKGELELALAFIQRDQARWRRVEVLLGEDETRVQVH